MLEPRILDTRRMVFNRDARFPEVGVKLLESRATHSALSLIIARLEPGGVIAMHDHPIETETAYILSGMGVLRAGERDYLLEAGMMVTIPPGLAHSMTNHGELPLEILALHSPATR